MEKELVYPEVDEVIEFNQLALSIVRATKSDSHGVLSSQKISLAIEKSRSSPGDLFHKAAVLMHSLTTAHAFASGNRRTAFITTKYFVTKNKGRFNIPDNPENAVIMREMREGKRTDEEIGEWIKNGRIN